MKKKIVAAALCAAMVSSLAACGGSSDSTTAAAAGDTTAAAAAADTTAAAAGDTQAPAAADGVVSVFYYTYGDTYISSVRAALDSALQTAGVEYQDYDSNNSQTTQAEQVDTAIAKGTSLLVVNLVDSGSDDAAKNIISKAEAAGIICRIRFPLRTRALFLWCLPARGCRGAALCARFLLPHRHGSRRPSAKRRRKSRCHHPLCPAPVPR